MCVKFLLEVIDMLDGRDDVIMSVLSQSFQLVPERLKEIPFNKRRIKCFYLDPYETQHQVPATVTESRKMSFSFQDPENRFPSFTCKFQAPTKTREDNSLRPAAAQKWGFQLMRVLGWSAGGRAMGNAVFPPNVIRQFMVIYVCRCIQSGTKISALPLCRFSCNFFLVKMPQL